MNNLAAGQGENARFLAGLVGAITEISRKECRLCIAMQLDVGSTPAPGVVIGALASHFRGTPNGFAAQ